MNNERETWKILRQLRSVALAEFGRSGKRQKTFAAALEQSEELWTASSSMPPSVSPITLFYGLTQAAQALGALRVQVDWEAPQSHGLTLRAPEIADDQVLSLADVKVAPSGDGFVQQIAQRLGSPVLQQEASLASLICALAEADAITVGGRDPRPLAVGASTMSYNFQDQSDVVSMSVGPLPAELYQSEWNETQGVLVPLLPTPDDVQLWLAAYPTLRQLGRPQTIHHVNPHFQRPNEGYATVGWSVGRGLDQAERREFMNRLVDTSDGGDFPNGAVLPSVGGNTSPQHPLITWWIILYACSMLARYHPRAWVSFLDVNRSVDAVPMETVLETARSAVPKILCEELLTGIQESFALREVELRSHDQMAE
jgi:hypothetical protein